jgi:hypothetical protein
MDNTKTAYISKLNNSDNFIIHDLPLAVNSYSIVTNSLLLTNPKICHCVHRSQNLILLTSKLMQFESESEFEYVLVSQIVPSPEILYSKFSTHF